MIKRKVAAAIIREGKILLVRKRGSNIFISPGGKVEDMESDIQCLERELREELTIEIVGVSYLLKATHKSSLENDLIDISVYIVNIVGTPIANAEIEELIWVGSDYINAPIKIGSVFAEEVIPNLVKSKILYNTALRLDTKLIQAERVYVFDLDGTIIHNDPALDLKIIQALNQLKKSKARIIFATSRSYRGMMELPNNLIDGCDLILNNGALIVCGTQKTVKKFPMNSDIAKSLITRLIANQIEFYIEFGFRYAIFGSDKNFPHLLSKHVLYTQERITPNLDDEDFGDIVKISIAAKHNNIDILKLVMPYAQDINLTYHTSFDIMSKCITKYTALQYLLFEKPAYTVSFGNDHNDFELLVNSHKSFVVGNNLNQLRYSGPNLNFIGCDKVVSVIESLIV